MQRVIKIIMLGVLIAGCQQRSKTTPPLKETFIQEQQVLPKPKRLPSQWVRKSDKPLLDPCTFELLQVGSYYQISKETALMPELDPINPLEAASRMRKLQAGSIIKVLSLKEKRPGNPWYYVSCGQSNGWINCIALLGQDAFEIVEQ